MKKHSAFTLAEVLLTLAIIGVVAAMTVPSIMGSTEEKKLAASAKKAYNTIQTAVTMQQAQTDATPGDVTGAELLKFFATKNVAGGTAVIKATEYSSTYGTITTPDGIVFATSGTGKCINETNPTTAACKIVVDVNGVGAPTISGSKSGTTSDGRTITVLDGTSTSTNRDIIRLGVNGMNVFPLTSDKNAVKYITGKK